MTRRAVTLTQAHTTIIPIITPIRAAQARIGGRGIRDEQETHEARETRETRGGLEDLAHVRVGHDELYSTAFSTLKSYFPPIDPNISNRLRIRIE